MSDDVAAPGASPRLPLADQVQALRRLALVATRPAGTEIYQALVEEVARALGVALAMVAVFADARRTTMRTLAAVVHGEPMASLEYPLARSPCSEVVGKGYRFMPCGIRAGYGGDEVVARLGLDAYAAFPMTDSRGEPLGLVAVLDPRAIAGGDADHAEAVLKIAALRLAAELERSAANEALRRSAASYRAIFEAAEDSILVHDGDSLRLVDVNDRAVQSFGYTRDELLAIDPAELMAGEAPHDMAHALAHLALARQGRCPPFEWRTRLRGGQLQWQEVRLKPVTIDGAPRILAFMRDISERKAAESRLRASEEQYRAIFNASADALMLWNSHLQRVDVNAAHERIFGFAREDVVGRAFENLNYPEAFVRPRLEMVRRALAGEPSRVELEALRKDGRHILTELRTIPFQHRGEPHVLQIARDITERKKSEAERTQLEAQLRQAQKMEAIGQLTGGIAHDFNNILTSVIGYIVLALERAERQGDATLVRQLGAAQAAVQRARELIAQMLAFARRQRGDRRAIALAPVVRQAIELLRSTMPASIALDDAGLADAAGLPPVRADAVQIEQVLLNLCINARDALPRSGRIAVRLGEARHVPARCASCGQAIAPGRWLELEVADNGSGIAPEVLPRMFEPFFTTKEVGRGSGMGLAMVHGIVHEHEGHVVVRSEPGCGSSFRLLLPAASGPADAAAPGDAATGADVPLRGRVMLVEDEPMVAALMRELLEGWGLEVVAPADARAAAQWFDDPAHDVDLLLTDLTMPQMTGLDLAHHVGVMRPDLPVLLYSGDAEGVDDDALRRAGVRARIDKPVDPPRLKALLRRWLASR
ncbi:MAG TPA: PAS domain S-box protein [Burkholderiaceae bacterium]|nr:PAS domain S-box protein [Burkholderiaceae bacterium]